MASQSSSSACPNEGNPGGGSVADAFTTILYGVIVTQVAVWGTKVAMPEPPGKESIYPAVVSLFIILYFFIDWLSRIYLPTRLSLKKSENMLKRIVRGTFEIVILYMLLLASYSIIRAIENDGVLLASPAQASLILPFACFLVSTYIWNFLVSEEMSLGWWHLVKLALWGNAADDKVFENRLQILKIKFVSLEKDINTYSGKLDGRQPAIIISLLGCRALIISALQCVTNRLVWSPLAGAAVLVMSTTQKNGGPFFLWNFPAKIPASWCWFLLVIFVLILGILILAFLTIRHDQQLDDKNKFVPLILIISWIIVGGVTAAICHFQLPNLMRFWLIVLATVVLPAIIAFPTNEDTRKKYGWIIGAVSITVLFFGYLCLSAGELIVFFVLESVTMCLFILISSKEETDCCSKVPEATG
jgi:hypothetical protein